MDLQLVAQSSKNVENWVLAFTLSLVAITIQSFRWKKIINACGFEKESFRTVWRANWIGMFFNSFLPGSVSGDFVKVFYLKNSRQKNWKNKALLLVSALFDRVLGLVGLLLFAGVCSTYLYFFHDNSKLLAALTFSLMAAGPLFLAAPVFVTFFFQHLKRSRLGPHLYLQRTGILEKMRSLVSFFARSQLTLSSIYLLLLASFVSQILNCLIVMLLIIPVLPQDVEIIKVLCLVPIGLISLVLPLAPAGMGVSHFFFEHLFEYANVPGGASFFNIFFCYQILVNLLGIIPYLANKETPRDLVKKQAFAQQTK